MSVVLLIVHFFCEEVFKANIFCIKKKKMEYYFIYSSIYNISFWFLDKADKKAQRERELKMEREQIEREEEIKELSLKMRRKYVLYYYLMILMFNIFIIIYFF